MGCLSYSLEGSTVVQKVFNGKAAMPLLNKPTLLFSRTKILLCIIVHMKARVNTSDAELLDGCFFGIMSFVGQTLSKVGLTAGTASVSSAPSGLHSSTSLTILGLVLIYSHSGNSPSIYLYNCIIVHVPLCWLARRV